MNDNLNDRVLPEVPHVASKAQLLYLCREITEVMEASPNAHRLWYQVALRCNAKGLLVNQYGKTISFTVCATKAGIKTKNGTSRALKELIGLGLAYKLPRGGGGIHIAKVWELYQQVEALSDASGYQNDNPQVIKMITSGLSKSEHSKSLKEIKDTRVTREGSFFDDTRSRSSWRYRNARQSQDWDDDGATTMVCSTEVI